MSGGGTLESIEGGVLSRAMDERRYALLRLERAVVVHQ
jgi:hypothetical protein